MKPKNINFVLYITIFIIFILTRINHIYSSQELIDIDFRGLAILSTGFPFGIIKNTTVYDFVSPIYYLIGHFFFTIFKTDIAIKVLNSIISLANIVFFIKIGKLLLNKNLGKLLAILLIINHFYLYYSNKIAPYSLTFLTGTILIYFLLLFLKRPKKENFKKLTIANCAYLLIDNLGFIYVICELLGLFAMFYKKKKYKQYTSILAYYCFITFLFIFPINIIQYSNYTKMLIPNSFEGIGVNLSSLYLTVNEFFSPFLSFITPETQSKTTLGMLYYTFLNFDYKTINSLKIAFTLLYSSFLPLLLFLFSIIKSFKNYKLKLLFLISMLYFGTISFFALIQLIELNPIYFPQFFTTSIVILGYGIYSIKDTYTKAIIIVCLFLINFINPEIETYSLSIYKKHDTYKALQTLIDKEIINQRDIIIMPYNGAMAQLLYKNYHFFNFDYSMLRSGKKNSVLKNLSNKKAYTINRNNVFYQLYDYLNENKINDYLAQYFSQEYLNAENKFENIDKIVFVIDKLNTRPIPIASIKKISNSQHYSPTLRKIHFRNANFEKNQSEIFYNALFSQTLYNLSDLIGSNFLPIGATEFKKLDNELFEKEGKLDNIYNLIGSLDSDYLFIFYKKP